MKANELRIGNWVQLLEPIQIKSGRQIDMCELNYLPIQITHELLLKNKFIKEVCFEDEFDCYFELSSEKDSFYCSLYLVFCQNKWWFSDEYDSQVWKTIPANGVHSIQNRWYSLTGEELEIVL